MSETLAQLADTIPALVKARVLVVGDLMLDHYVHGAVNRMAPEAPVPILAATKDTYIAGGAAGVVANIGGLGARASVLGVVAADSAGDKMQALMQAAGADTNNLTIVSDRPSIVKMRFVKGDELLLRTDYEKAAPLSAADEKKLIGNIPAALKGCGAVIMSDYGKGVLTASVMEAVIKAAQQMNIPVLVDPKGKDFTIYHGADFVTPNAKELGEATNMPTTTEDEVLKAALHLINTAGIKTVIAKRSEHGVMVVTQDGKLLSLPATAKNVRGVAGAGDTVIATLATALAAGLPVDQAVTIANEAAGIIVAKPGTTPIEKEELQAVLSGQSAARDVFYEAPVHHDWTAARKQIDAWKAKGETVGFTNGCFDILHYGHVNYLNRARERCDRLVIGLNADASITRLKGAGRPVHEELSRGAVLAALGCVDMVVFFGADQADDDKPVRLIDALHPDICFKGGDYKVEDLPEAKTVFAYGGQFEIMPMYEGHSTTSAIRKMQKVS
jgi:D-beta-D-heptose 7-phosphate kinase/D-beta-D-heptose 1-phosphate adenosyltransferase